MMARVRVLGIIAVVLVSALLAACSEESEQKTSVGTSAKKPNIVLVLTDDQDEASLARMTEVNERLVQRGTTFENSVATFPLCCPARATILRGQYAHNHHITYNIPPNGGEQPFEERGLDKSTVATWLTR